MLRETVELWNAMLERMNLNINCLENYKVSDAVAYIGGKNDRYNQILVAKWLVVKENERCWC